MTDYYSYTNHY